MATRDTIKNIIRHHLVEQNGQLYCQALLGCGFVANTVPNDIPDHKGLEELPTSDASNGGIVCGAALMGRRPIYVVRYQGFLWYNAVSIINYAAKSKEMWGEPCPVFVRGLAMEGSVGPVASNCHHSIISHMPGIKVYAPMTSREWESCWNDYMNGDDPVFCSEHRYSYDIDGDLSDNLTHEEPDVTIIGIGAARLTFDDLHANTEYKINTFGINKLSSWEIKPSQFDSILSSKFVLVVDSDYTTCGISEHICYDVMTITDTKCYAVGLKNKSAGFAPATDNLTPTKEEILNKIKGILL
jgi:pyruvate/2-oxoglutarate/acetoin dehydrogenase E1 component